MRERIDGGGCCEFVIESVGFISALSYTYLRIYEREVKKSVNHLVVQTYIGTGVSMLTWNKQK